MKFYDVLTEQFDSTPDPLAKAAASQPAPVTSAVSVAPDTDQARAGISSLVQSNRRALLLEGVASVNE